ncbi:IS607 family element RNA-guided endonuclease TnpB [Nocardia tengchongensis]|uniref:IS607 family element RNA-guided endonuclease TnpB n=1 Tax=Nocardia tengchongensis TaxID=2055889 RepID=UPI00360A12E2
MVHQDGWIARAYRYALDPTSFQADALESHCGAARFAYNHMLTQVTAVIDQRTAERSYGIPDEALTPASSWSLPSLRKSWNQRKDDVAPWWRENSKEAYNSGLAALADGLDIWSKARRGERAGTARFPRFKRKHRAAKSVRFTTGAIRVEPGRHHVTLPRLGRIRTHESTRKLGRRLEQGSARILSATVRYEGGRWYCSFHALVQPSSTPGVGSRTRNPIVGVDVGVRDLLVVAAPDGTEVDRVPAPRPLAAQQARLRRLQRRAARRRGPWDDDAERKRRPSQRWHRAQRSIVKTHARVSNLRRNVLHHATTELVRRHEVIVLERLTVAAMNRRGGKYKRGLNRAIGDAALGRIRTMLEYKADWSGRATFAADRHYPSTQLCSGCGAKTKLPLSERTYRCRSCGLVIDRDLNAAINLARLGVTLPDQGASTGTGSSPAASVPAGKGCGAVRKTSSARTVEKAGGREASTQPDAVPARHRTGTAAS